MSSFRLLIGIGSTVFLNFGGKDKPFFKSEQEIDKKNVELRIFSHFFLVFLRKYANFAPENL